MHDVISPCLLSALRGERWGESRRLRLVPCFRFNLNQVFWAGRIFSIGQRNRRFRAWFSFFFRVRRHWTFLGQKYWRRSTCLIIVRAFEERLRTGGGGGRGVWEFFGHFLETF